MECSICIEKYNNSNHKKIQCMYCETETCQACLKTYLLDQSTPHCMNTNCGREWTRHFLYLHFPQTFLNKEYKIHRENVLFEQERALLVETQPYVENEIKKEKCEKEMHEIRKTILELTEQYNKVAKELYNSKNMVVERQQFTRTCPENECKGFLSQSWKCGICEKWFCKDCHQCKGNTRTEEHVCNPTDLLTVQLLETNTKTCPKCNIGIFKIEGCNQMFCTNCNTAFDWTTRRIVNGNIHNPHYFDWMQKQRDNNMQRETMNCRNREIRNSTLRKINAYIQNINGINEEKETNLILKIGAIFRNLMHIRMVVLPTYQFNYVEKNRYLRIKYMRNKIPLNEFKTLIQKNEKKFKKYEELHNVYQLLIDTCSDIILRFESALYEFYEQKKPYDEIYFNQILQEIPVIVKYVNNCFMEIVKTYKMKSIKYNDRLELKKTTSITNDESYNNDDWTI